MERDLEVAKESAIQEARAQRVVTQEQLRRVVDARQDLEDFRARREEVMDELIRDAEWWLEFEERCLLEALGAGAKVEPGELSVKLRPRLLVVKRQV